MKINANLIIFICLYEMMSILFISCVSIKNTTSTLKPLNTSNFQKQILKPYEFKITKLETCKDPSERVLFDELFSFVFEFQNFYGVINSEFFKKIYNHSIIPHCRNFSDACEFIDSFANHTEDEYICKWREEIVQRENFYPRTILKRVCSCNKCPHVNNNVTKIDSVFKCSPIYNMMPALKKSGNCINRVYEWEKVFEHIPIACSCTAIKKLSNPS
jgi:hypothetical protein